MVLLQGVRAAAAGAAAAEVPMLLLALAAGMAAGCCELRPALQPAWLK
jgi:hypothetical protein